MIPPLHELETPATKGYRKGPAVQVFALVFNGFTYLVLILTRVFTGIAAGAPGVGLWVILDDARRPAAAGGDRAQELMRGSIDNTRNSKIVREGKWRVWVFRKCAATAAS